MDVRACILARRGKCSRASDPRWVHPLPGKISLANVAMLICP